MNRPPFSIGEWYHCYNRGVDKRRVFTSQRDYERFLQLLYLANDTKPVRRDNISKRTTEDILQLARTQPLVSIGAYCLMPNHIHLLLHEIKSGGITSFTRKLGTAYAMYFNIKYERTGNLFMKPIRSRHITDDEYLQTVVNYIHANPAELHESDWKNGVVRNMDNLERELLAYRYSSFRDHTDQKRISRVILGSEIFEVVESSHPRQMLDDAAEYYREISEAKMFS